MIFIKDFTEGTLPRFFRSQIVSSSGLCDLMQSSRKVDDEAFSNSSVICVPELNSFTFTNYVLGKSIDAKDNRTLTEMSSKLMDKDILVMYYAPWCGFCTSIAHIYLDVARFFAFSNEIIFTRQVFLESLYSHLSHIIGLMETPTICLGNTLSIGKYENFHFSTETGYSLDFIQVPDHYDISCQDVSAFPICLHCMTNL